MKKNEYKPSTSGGFLKSLPIALLAIALALVTVILINIKR